MTDAVEFELQSFQGHNRLLLVFARDENDPQLKQQQTLIRDHEKEMSQSDVRLFTVLSSATAAAGGSPDDWRRRFGITGEGFQAVLVGKDGTEKKRWTTPVAWDELKTDVDGGAAVLTETANG